MKGELTILPVLVRTCRYQITELSAIQFALPPNKSIAKMGREERREAWVRLSEMIEHALNGRTAGNERLMAARTHPSRKRRHSMQKWTM